MENSQENNYSGETTIDVTKDGRVLFCSDGVVEETLLENETEKEIKTTTHSDDGSTPVNPKTLHWGPWFSYYAWKSGTKVLNAVDYAGESLATFFGITTPKYQLEIDEYHRLQEEKRAIEQESAGWVIKGEGDIPLVLNEPSREINRI